MAAAERICSAVGRAGHSRQRNAFGFGLNNSGGDTILLRNAQSNLIARVVYSTLSTNSLMTRYPDINGAIVAQSAVSTNAATFGKQSNGRLYSEIAPVVAPAAILLTAAFGADAAVRLRWNAESGRTYSVFQSASAAGPFTSLASGLTFASNAGEYADTKLAGVQARFYRISTP